jgi:hypothetical protein
MIHKLMQAIGLEEKGYAIWWLSQEDCEALETMIDYSRGFIPSDGGGVYSYEPCVTRSLRIPGYIAREYRSRLGRPGRGRLWIPPEIPVTECVWDDELPVCQRAISCGGIVVHARDWHKLRDLPGFITDLEMRYLSVGKRR